jgi:26S proteasome regulatory subunit N1
VLPVRALTRGRVTDLLSKLSHDADADTAQTAILGLGLIGAGTNNARIAGTCFP